MKDIISQGLSTDLARLYFIDMLKALYYCHRIACVVHRDIKPDNIMINHENQAVLIDFGLSFIKDQSDPKNLNEAQGSLLYFAPEMLFKTEEKEKIKIKGE